MPIPVFAVPSGSDTRHLVFRRHPDFVAEVACVGDPADRARRHAVPWPDSMNGNAAFDTSASRGAWPAPPATWARRSTGPSAPAPSALDGHRTVRRKMLSRTSACDTARQCRNRRGTSPPRWNWGCRDWPAKNRRLACRLPSASAPASCGRALAACRQAGGRARHAAPAPDHLLFGDDAVSRQADLSRTVFHLICDMLEIARAAAEDSSTSRLSGAYHSGTSSPKATPPLRALRRAKDHKPAWS